MTGTVEANDVSYQVRGRALVSGVSGVFPAGQLHMIVGPNGAGKSTLIKILSRLLPPAGGRVSYDGHDIARDTERHLAVRRAVLSQAVEIAFSLTVREVVSMGRYPHFGARAASADDAIVEEVMAFFDVAGMADRDYLTLSGGEKQRVNFARVFAQIWRPSPHATRVLFLDEPLTFLDIGHQLDFMHKVREIAVDAGMVVVGVLHDISLAARLADQVWLMNGGRLVASGSSAEVLTPARVRDVFGVEPILVEVPGMTGTQLVFQ
jgi:iron complex transport system ATP-binding protein